MIFKKFKLHISKTLTLFPNLLLSNKPIIFRTHGNIGNLVRFQKIYTLTGMDGITNFNYNANFKGFLQPWLKKNNLFQCSFSDKFGHNNILLKNSSWLIKHLLPVHICGTKIITKFDHIFLVNIKNTQENASECLCIFERNTLHYEKKTNSCLSGYFNNPCFFNI